MTTNVSIIESSLRLIGVVGESQSASAEQGATALLVLNQLMESLVVEDVNLGYFAQTSTTATCPIPAWAERGIISRLAKALLAIYPTAVLSPDLMDDAQNGFAVIQRICFNQKNVALDASHLGLGEGYRRRFNIITGI